MNQTLRHPFVSRAVSFLCLLLLWVTHILPLRAESWPTEWRFEPLENISSEWWQSLRVNTVPGVLYHLQESNSLAADSWSTLETIYGSGSEWICALFPGTAPSVIPPPGQPVIPSTPATPIRFAYLIIGRTTTGDTLLSWTSLDDHTSRRMQLSGVTLDPVWDEFDAAYFNQHGNHHFALSPRLGNPVTFTDSAVTLGTLDTAMIADFTTHLPTITTNIQNSVAMAALYSHQPPPSGERKFYRIAANWSVDSDGDGRFDWQEIIFDNSNPFAADSDGDGNPDIAAGTGVTPSACPTPTDAESATPVAHIEQQLSSVYRGALQSGTPDVRVDPGWDHPAQLTELDYLNLEQAATFEEFVDVVDDLPLDEDNWSDSPLENHFSGRWISGPDEDDHLTDNFEHTHAAYRLKLDKPAPLGGYQIKLRVGIIRQSIHLDPYETTIDPHTEGDPLYQEITLECAQGETEGTPVTFPYPTSPSQNKRFTFVPISITTREPDNEELNLMGPVSENGTCVTSDEPFVVDSGNPNPCLLPDDNGSPLEIHWMMGKLKGDGKLDEWKAIFEPNPLDPLNPLALKGAHRSVPDIHPGIYQLKAVLLLPDSTMIDFPYARMRHARSIKNSDNETNELLKAGHRTILAFVPIRFQKL